MVQGESRIRGGSALKRKTPGRQLRALWASDRVGGWFGWAVADKVAPVLDQATVSGGNFLTIAICARALSPTEQGKVGVVLSTYLITSIVNQTSILQMAAVRLAREGTDDSLTKRLADLQSWVALVTTLGMMAALVGLGGTIGMEASWAEMLAAGLFFWGQQLADFDRRISYSSATSLRGLTSSLAVYPPRILLLLSLSPESMLAVFTIAAATASVPALITLSRVLSLRAGLRERFRFHQRHARMSRWLVAGAPFAWAWAQVPVYFLGNASGMAAVGAFVSVRSITNVANVGLEVLETHYSPLLARVYHQEGRGPYLSSVLRVLGVGVAFWGCGLVAVLLAGDRILVAAVGDAYAGYEDVLVWLWGGALPYFLFRVDGINLRNRGATVAIPLGFLAGTVSSVLGCLLFLPHFGPTGAAMARALAAGGLLVGQLLARPFARGHPDRTA